MKHIILLIAGLFFVATASAKGEYRKFKKLSFANQVKFVRTLRKTIVTMETIHPELTRGRKKKTASLLEVSLFSNLFAVEEKLRCMYGGFVIKGANSSCRPISKIEFEQSDKVKTVYECSESGKKTLCNPLVFGTNGGTPFCVKKQKWATAECDKIADNSYENTVAIINAAPAEFEKYMADFNRLCRDPGPAKVEALSGRPGAIEDVKKTCEVALARLEKILKDEKLDKKLADKIKIKTPSLLCEHNSIDVKVYCVPTAEDDLAKSDKVVVENYFNNCFKRKCNELREKLDKKGCFSQLDVNPVLPDTALLGGSETVSAQLAGHADCRFTSENCSVVTSTNNCKESLLLDQESHLSVCLKEPTRVVTKGVTNAEQ